MCKRRKSTPVANAVKSLLYKSTSDSVPSLRWGRENEENARLEYVKEMTRRGRKITTTKSGLVVSQIKGYIACSPDDLVTDNDILGVAEYKCPYKARDITPIQACEQFPDFFCSIVDGEIRLRKKHNYYYQVQGVMGVTRRYWCDFVVWTPKGISIERIKFDSSLWEAMQPKLDWFFEQALLPELAAPEYPHKRPIREPGTW